MKLRIFLPSAERPEAATRFGWMLFDARRALLREGRSTLDEIPRAEEVEAVLPAARVLFARLKLPRVNAATIRELLPFAVEDRLLADPSNIHAVAGHAASPGETVVAVIDREWLRAMLDALAAGGIRPSRAWSESCLLAGGHGDWHLVWSERRGMLVDDDGVSATFDHDASATYPLALRLALGYPDLFRGAILNAGSDSIGSLQVPLPPRELLLKFQNSVRIIYVTGAADTHRHNLDLASMGSMRRWCVFDVRDHAEPFAGHDVAGGAAMFWAFIALRQASHPDPDRLAACRSSIEADLKLRLHQVESLLESRRQDDARRLLTQVDAEYGGLAAPSSIDLGRP